MVKSYISGKIYLSNSKIHNIGMFAKEKICKGDIVFIKGGHILEKHEIYTSKTINSYLPIDDNFFIAARTKQEEELVKLFINHSCDPNCGLRGEITFIAIDDIQKNEELTCDYAFIDNEDYTFECTCGSKMCRGTVTGYDWKRKDIQQKYLNFFASYLKEKCIR